MKVFERYLGRCKLVIGHRFSLTCTLESLPFDNIPEVKPTLMEEKIKNQAGGTTEVANDMRFHLNHCT